ncbi:alpha/beta fold hydrolase [Streptomyces sp. XM4011]|uniref:thioesterase II family protein n=1 Tax=Streptomyces TaxID=1883 RepID=UPI001FFA2698|nr:thioesterase domain-containing protein [Streptomyces sp. XM4011]MCK1816664.1 alpha/beta fold hydrolase [Streptomyces sp. XM4011]
MSDHTPWLLGPGPGAPRPPDPPGRTRPARVFCVAHAGGGASAFRAWQARAPAGARIHPVQLPGRENRMGDPLPDDLTTLADLALRGLARHLRPPYALFGHSFGGLLCHAMAHRAPRAGLPAPDLLLISATRPPHLPTDHSPHTLTDDALLAWVRATHGLDASVAAHPVLLARLLHTLRADLRLAAAYRPPEEPLSLPLRVLGTHGDPVVPPDCLPHWRRYTRAEFSLDLRDGDHFSLYRAPPEPLLRAIDSLHTMSIRR